MNATTSKSHEERLAFLSAIARHMIDESDRLSGYEPSKRSEAQCRVKLDSIGIRGFAYFYLAITSKSRVMCAPSTEYRQDLRHQALSWYGHETREATAALNRSPESIARHFLRTAVEPSWAAVDAYVNGCRKRIHWGKERDAAVSEIRDVFTDARHADHSGRTYDDEITLHAPGVSFIVRPGGRVEIDRPGSTTVARAIVIGRIMQEQAGEDRDA